MHKKNIRIFALSFALGCALVAPAVALAAGGFVPLSDANFNTLFKVQSASGGQTDLGTFISNAFNVALSLGAILAVMRIAWAGYQYMSSDAWGEKSHAKEILGDVAIGILLLMSIWLILKQIDPQILTIRLHGVTNPQPTPAQQLQAGTQPI